MAGDFNAQDFALGGWQGQHFMTQGNTEYQQQGGAGNGQNNPAANNPAMTKASVLFLTVTAEATINGIKPKSDDGEQHDGGKGKHGPPQPGCRARRGASGIEHREGAATTAQQPANGEQAQVASATQ